MLFLTVVVALLGLVIGSFLNVVIYRVPHGQSLIAPASHCPNCQAPVRNRHNVPVLGWLMLRGRCADCAGPVSVRYPLVEFGTGLAFVAVTVALYRTGELAALPALLYFTSIGIALTAIDLDCQRLPDSIVLPSYPVLALLLTGGSVWSGDYYPLLRAAIGCAALYGWYLMLNLIYPDGMGFGDVKLAGLIGAVLGYLGYAPLLVGGSAAFVLGGVAGAALIMSRRRSGRTPFPFGPFMIAAALLALFAAAPISESYLRLTGI